jgi:hypothetical protein
MGGLLAFGLSCFTGNAKTNARASGLYYYLSLWKV